jgi:phosphate:Na+ symporter
MDIFGVLTFLGGLALFLYGMNTLGEGLAKMAGSRLEHILEKLTGTPIRGVLLGAAVTAVIQSSSATTVMVVGFVNSGIMRLSQAVGIIMGANVGTTITSWILSLSGLESGNVFVRLLKPSSFSPVLALVGVIFLLFSRDERKKDIGTILLGFAVLMTGMDTMSSAVKPLANVPAFTSLFVAFQNPILGMLVGALLTAIIQSSSASVGILQAMCATGAVSYGAAIPIIMGQNIGTCVTAILSGIGASKNAKRAALVHLYFNLIGTIFFMVVFYALNAAIHFPFLAQSVGSAGIAVVHTAFNLAATLLLLPFSGWLERLAVYTIPEGDSAGQIAEDPGIQLLDERFLEHPAFAVSQVGAAVAHLLELVNEALTLALSLHRAYNKKNVKRIRELGQRVESYEQALGTYLLRLCGKPLTEQDNRQLMRLMQSVDDLKRMAQIGVGMANRAKDMHRTYAQFSKKAQAELQTASEALEGMLADNARVLSGEAVSADLLSNFMELTNALSTHNRKRLLKGKCTPEAGVALADILTDYERIAGHCAHMANLES